MSQFKTLEIGKLVEPVATWNPLKADHDDEFDYIDLSAIDQDTKTITTPRQILCGEAPSRARQIVSTNDVLVSTVRPNLNGVAIVPPELDQATASTGFCVLRPRSTSLNSSYLFHWVKSPQFVACMTKKATGQSYPAVSDKIVSESLIPAPPLPEQIRIAAILDKADALRVKRKEALAQLDSLTQAIFIDMFGDPVTNPKGWAVKPLNNFIITVTNGMTRRRSEIDLGSDIVLRLRDIRSGWIDFSEVNRITLEPSETKRFGTSSGDLLFIRVNGNPDYVGRCAVFEGYTEPVFFNDHVMRVKVDPTKIDSFYLAFLLNGSHGKNEIAMHRRTSAGQHTINQDGLGKIQVPTPSVTLQAEFAKHLKTIDKQKIALTKSLALLDTLFASLQHHAFRGEL